MKMIVFWAFAPCSSQKLTDILEVITASIIRVMMMEAVSTSETTVNFHETAWCKIPEESFLQN
jgi:hypothetical protein